ncbi:MAG: VCBS repeat-containing protein [Deltaproteobacteria bacterium]|nr:VCBS repeat-containing protein [Deltaproteobacteria bacterium]
MPRWIFSMTVSALLLSGCGAGEYSVELHFPNRSAYDATDQVVVYGIKRDDGPGGAEPTCADQEEALLNANEIAENPVDNPISVKPFNASLGNFPIGDPVLVVVGYNDTDPEIRRPILFGCTEEFGREEGTHVVLELKVLVPKDVVLRKLGGDLQVGFKSQPLPEPLRVRIEGLIHAANEQGTTHPLPGLPVVFEPLDPSLTVGGAATGAAATANTDAEGIASIGVTLPDAIDLWQIKASSADAMRACVERGTEVAKCTENTEQTFSISATSPARFNPGSVVNNGALFNRAIAVGLGNVAGGAGLDAVILGCQGSDQGCTPGRAAVAPLGQTQVAVVADLESSRSLIRPAGNLGVVPAGLFVGPMVNGSGDDFAIVNSRRNCPGCREGSEILIFDGQGAQVAVQGRYSITASNAVGLTAFAERGSTLFTTFFTAGQGRSTLGRPCNAAMCLNNVRWQCGDDASCASCNGDANCLKMCHCDLYCASEPNPATCAATCIDSPDDCSEFCRRLPRLRGCADLCDTNPESCGCGPREICECPSGGSSGGCTCGAQDKHVDMLANRSAGASFDFYNKMGCRLLNNWCIKGSGNPPDGDCQCLDNPENQCKQGRDGCACLIPDRIAIGDQVGNQIGNALVVGQFRPTGAPDLIVASQAGIEFIPYLNTGWSSNDRKPEMAPSHLIGALRLDDDDVLDLIVLAQVPCLAYLSTDALCPRARQPAEDGSIDGRPQAGCLASYLREPGDSLDATKDGGCLRHPLPFRPDGHCSGDFNGDGQADLALSTFAEPTVYLFLSNANGGLLDPPQAIALPPGAGGGPIACGDINDDLVDDFVVLGSSGTIAIVTSAP